MHAHSHCDRWVEIGESVKDMDNTERMYQELDDDEEQSGFFNSLRTRSGLNLDTEEMH